MMDVKAGEFDNGKMWTFEYAPLEYFAETYGFQPDDAWFERARLGALRLSNCSASFVSPNGLVLTNHHCARESVTEVSGPGETILDDGFYASSLGDERETSRSIDQLIAIQDVTAEVHAAVEGTADAQRAQAEQAIEEELSQRIAAEHGGEDAGIVVEIIGLWDGAKYSAYVFRRYSDLRLVLAPELQIGFFGGDYDNFTFPRYNLDFSFYRIYDEAGNPVKPEFWFEWSEGGVEHGDAVFVIGNPGGSSRLQTAAQLEWRGAARDKAIYALFKSRADAMQAFYDQDPETGEEIDLRDEIASLRNSEKAFHGMCRPTDRPTIRSDGGHPEAAPGVRGRLRRVRRAGKPRLRRGGNAARAVGLLLRNRQPGRGAGVGTRRSEGEPALGGGSARRSAAGSFRSPLGGFRGEPGCRRPGRSEHPAGAHA
jgi:hypothetical protein